ncbi:exo-alpha-sialidase [Larkinella soli]|uniref:exo-alpha-sialidase n=1 Tax=Larkinella soli TaxID=1770527 RepID=UPI000FFB6048|nr:exo-alpha-sialidase [Larkinella soli]
MNVYRTGKLIELISFMIWELQHFFGLIEKDNYLKFTGSPYYRLKKGKIEGLQAVDAAGEGNRPAFTLKPTDTAWKLCFISVDQTYWGTVHGQDNILVFSRDQGRTLEPAHVFNHPITSLFISRKNHLFVCSDGGLWRSETGTEFKPVLSFTTRISYFLFNNGMTELPDGTLLIGEYGSLWLGKAWKNLAYLYSSDSDGREWKKNDFLIRYGVNKHIHIVKYSPLLKAVVLTDGDNKKRIWLNRSLQDFGILGKTRESGWNLLHSFHIQTGGYTSMVEAGNTVLLGSDYLGGTNFLMSTVDGLNYRRQVIPDPYRRCPLINMVTRKTAGGTETWALLHCSISSGTRCLLMVSSDEGRTWKRVLDYDGKKAEVRLVSSSDRPQETILISVITQGRDGDVHRVYTVSDHPEETAAEVNQDDFSFHPY